LTEDLLVGLAMIVTLGVSAQWLAWRLRLPSILVLLIFGFVAGPLLNLVNPDEILGEWLFPIVSLSVAIILFEGGLSLKVSEIHTTGHVVRNLVTVGALATWMVAATGAYFILGFPLRVAILFGAILIVTGPTVIIPLLRHVRAVGSISSLAKWEGIVNDPIGAIVAVLVFEAIVVVNIQQAATTVVISLVETILIGVVLGAAGAYGMAFLLRRYWIPDHLQSVVALMAVVSTFALSNLLQQESGLVTVTLMGIILTNQRGVNIKPIVEFKENLGVLLLSVLFIILSARLSLEDLVHLGPQSIVFLFVLILIARPLSVWISTIGSSLKWQEKVFLAWMAPRGIVAAAVTSVFALELHETIGLVEADLMVPEMFLIIVGTVTIYGLGAGPLGNWLGVANPDPQGNLIVGAHQWARQIGKALQDAGFKVMLLDTNHENVTLAKLDGVPAMYASVLSESLPAELELGSYGRLLALTHNDEVNALATLHYAEIFGRANVFQLHPKEEEHELREVVPVPLRGRLLFGSAINCDKLIEKHQHGAVIKQTPLTEQYGYAEFREMYGTNAIPLFLVDENNTLIIFTDDQQPLPRPGQTLISLVSSSIQSEPTNEQSQAKPAMT
jgi:NhaP-type Na+/H+ or K+/H+ antiporter